MGEAVTQAAGALQKTQNGADILNKDTFVRNAGAARALSAGVPIGGDNGNWTTTEFVAWLESQGAFEHPYWMCKGSWSYGSNKIITDTGCGKICLAGAVVEVMGMRSAMTIRVTTPTTTSGNGIPSSVFTYINHGEAYSPGWRREFNRAGDTMTGPLTAPTLTAAGNVLCGNGAGILSSDGNVYGPIWGGWLSNWLNQRIVTDIRLGSVESSMSWNGPGYTDQPPYVLTGAHNFNADPYIDSVYRRPLQKCVNGGWYNVSWI